MTRPPHLRSGLISAALVVLAVAGWLLLAPTQIGGETSYVKTSGVSMQPRFHSGDLALVRPAGHYRVGEIVAYRSKLLHVVVLHRIIAIKGDRYVLKGDNNDFVDPARPTRADVVGRLTAHVPHGGRVLHWLHTPLSAALLCGAMALLLFMGAKQQRRRRDRRRPPEARGGRQPHRPASTAAHAGNLGADPQVLFTLCAVAGVVFLTLGLLAFAHPASKPATTKTPYTEKVSFGYHANAPAGPVYPDGVVNTGDPIFLKLVHRVRVKAHYRLATNAPQSLGGTMEVLLRLASPTGWSRTIQIAPPKAFKGDYASADVTLDVPALQSMIRKVERLTGGAPGASYDISVTPRVHVTGTLADKPLTRDYAPALALKLDGLQLRPAPGAPAAEPTPAPTAGSGPTPEQKAAFNPSRRGNVAASTTVTNELGIRGHDLPVATLRWIALIGFLLAASGALLTGVRLLAESTDPTAHIHRYRHLIVPIAGTTFDPARPPIDVTSIGALAQLAERSERLILHHQRDGADTYLVDDEGTLYRYQAHSHLRQIPALSVVDGAVYEGAAR
jgi:signal peptidase I